MDSLGRHDLQCKLQIGRHSKHSQIHDIVNRALTYTDFPSKLKPTGLCRKDGKRPDRLILFPFKQGKCVLCDVTCVDTLAESYIASMSVTPGIAPEKVESSKMALYSKLMKDYIFTPIVLETLGLRGGKGHSLIKERGHKIM